MTDRGLARRRAGPEISFSSFYGLSTMGYVFNFNDAKAYEAWHRHARNRFVADLEGQLLIKMLQPMRGESILEIGCGTGECLHSLLDLGLSCTGIDPSPYMLDISFKNLGHRVELYRGFAEDLPFDDNSFNHAFFVTTLEFVADPRKSLAEAFRVSKDKVFIGVLNRYALKGVERRLKGLFNDTLYNHARFFSVWGLKRLIRETAGDVPIEWRTVYQLPVVNTALSQCVETHPLVQRCPFGSYLGMLVNLVPRFRTRPLAIRYRPKQTPRAVSG